jgi:hypothetical protein
MTPSPTARRRLTDRMQRDWYVFKVDFLAQDVPSGFRKSRRRELRSDLTAAAAWARLRSWHTSSSWPKAASSRTCGPG